MHRSPQNPDLSALDITIAVTGLKTGDNPQPGVPVIRSIRAAGFKGRIIGLVYDSMESGIYLDDLVDEVYQMPYPSAGAEAFLTRMEYIVAKSKIDVIIPTLDAEVILYIRLQDELRKLGIHSYLPTEECFLLRDKTKLATYFPPRGILVPDTALVSEISQIISSKEQYPMMIKGRYYEAYKANNVEEGLKYFYEIESRWGLPIILQKMIPGDEYNIVIVGDGEGGILGMVPQKKLVITDKGKGFGGVVVKNQQLEEFATKVIALLKWRGPCELEVMRGYDRQYYLIEINPRFPAWVRLAEGSGQNQPAAVVLKALGQDLAPLPQCKSGTLFIRHAEDIITDISLMGEISAKSELMKKEK
jgi:carbamoyl-phosphate synthase large subunit